MLFDDEEAPQPATEEVDHPRITVGETDRAVPLRTFAGVQSQSRHQELTVAESTDPVDAFPLQPLDLFLLGELQAVGRPASAAAGHVGRDRELPCRR